MSAKGEALDLGNEDHVAQRKQSIEQREALRNAGLRKALADEGARAWLFMLLERCGVFTTSFTGNSETFMREGQRNVGLFVLAEIERADKQAFQRMKDEAGACGERGYRAKSMKPIDGDE